MKTYTVIKKETIVSRNATTAQKTWNDDHNEVLQEYEVALKTWSDIYERWKQEHTDQTEYSEIAVCEDVNGEKHERDTWIIFKKKPGAIFGPEIAGQTFKDPFVGELKIVNVEIKETRTNLIPPNWEVPAKPQEPVLFPRTVGDIRQVTRYVYELLGSEIPCGHFEEVPQEISVETVVRKTRLPGRVVWPELRHHTLRVIRKTALICKDRIEILEEVIDRNVTEVERINPNVSDREMSENMFGMD